MGSSPVPFPMEPEGKYLRISSKDRVRRERLEAQGSGEQDLRGKGISEERNV